MDTKKGPSSAATLANSPSTLSGGDHKQVPIKRPLLLRRISDHAQLD